jgi:hypothetical protein
MISKEIEVVLGAMLGVVAYACDEMKQWHDKLAN